ncbi:ubiquinone biosynthesis monooxygenase Coq7 [Kappamyces sp. JEL0829]|nr:ubiquinone biosynthesis monooxygenase Coq7 [Kappamyces sp. JEL0829]
MTAHRISYKQAQVLARMLRVDHAGEIGANFIYKGQLQVLPNDRTIEHMWDQEKKHLRVFEDILPTNRVRPSALRPFWEVAGLALGAGTAMLGREAAMACTEAVETVIGQHYNDQLRELLEMAEADPELGSSQDFQNLVRVLQEFRDEELEHKATAIGENARSAPLHSLLSSVIQAGCRVAIKIAERV